MKEVYIIAGPNGAGKTTAAYDLLPRFLNTNEYVNANSIAHALSPSNIAEVLMMNKDKKSKLIDQGLRKAVAKAIMRHKLLGQSIAVWKNGKVIIIPAKKIKLSRQR